METKQFEGHTVGPWAVTGASIHTTYSAFGNTIAVARVYESHESDAVDSRAQADANAALMAAAPALLVQRDALLAALKAMQKKSCVVNGCFNGCGSSVGHECNCLAGEVRAAIALCQS